MNSGDDVLSLLLLNIDTSYAGQKATYKLLAPKGQVRARSCIAGQCYPAPPLPVRIKTSCAGQKATYKLLAPKGQVLAFRR